jgi:hypothetical protein
MEQVANGKVQPCLRLSIKKGVCIPILIWLTLAASIIAADLSLEYQVKSAFLLNFTKFIEWPAGAFSAPDSPISICIWGENPFGTALDQMVKGEVVSGRRVAVAYVKETPPPQSCHIVFWGGPNKEIRTLPAFGPGALTVGEGASFLRDGGMIAFVIENHRVRFEINQAAAERAGLKLSSKLLSVAKPAER